MSDPKKDSQVEAAKKQIRMASAYQKVFESPEGKQVLHDLMRRFHMIAPCVSKAQVSGGVDPYQLAFRDGERNAVLYIMSVMKVDVEKLIKFIEGAHKNET